MLLAQSLKVGLKPRQPGIQRRDGYIDADQPALRSDPAPIVPPKTWLLATGWRARAGGALRADEAPVS